MSDRGLSKAQRMRKQRALLADSQTIVRKRDQGRCFRCNKVAHEIHHRRPRQMGGTSHRWINEPANLVSLCGSDHRWAEAHYAEAVAEGYRIPHHQRADTWPITDHNGQRVLLHNDGTITREEHHNA
jgi:5-methylcytosine-specific restriction protein A